MEFHKFIAGLLLLVLGSTGVHGSALLRDRRGLQSWRASLEGRSCMELGDLCEMSFGEENCLVTSSVCYELLQCRSKSEETQCTVEWSKVLQTYDRELFREVQGIMWSFFAMPPKAQQTFINSITSSLGEGGGSVIGRSVTLFDSLAKVLPVVETDLMIKFNNTAWQALMEKIQQSPEEILGNIKIPEFSSESSSNGEGGGLMSQLTSVFILPTDFSFGQFLSTIKWDKGLLENLGLNDESFNSIVRSFPEEQGLLEAFASDISLLVKNVSGLRKILPAG
eukprot:GHVS01045151.1.p1 GENE.GHVS01045151.1~~GHVS01045151.1.p1  ORF type:complete len:280 (-),score=34.80 GHVS01045151.1:222-1061(-)